MHGKVPDEKALEKVVNRAKQDLHKLEENKKVRDGRYEMFFFC
jgi:hypothetical protein